MSRQPLCYTGAMNKSKKIQNTLKKFFSKLRMPYAKDKDAERQPENYLQHLHTDTLEIEIGYNLVPLVDKSIGGTLLDQISRLRKRFAIESGLIVPPVRVRDNMSIEPNEYRIRLHCSQIGKAMLDPTRLVAIDTGKVKEELSGESFAEPSYNLKAYWIDLEQKADAEKSGYDLVDCSTVIAMHLSNIIQQNSAEIMGRNEIKIILDNLRKDEPIIVDEVLIEKKISLGNIQSILQNLLREGLSIRNMGRILESISDNIELMQGEPHLLNEAIRLNLRRQILEPLLSDNKKELSCITIEPQAERYLREGIHQERDLKEGLVSVLDPDSQALLQKSLIVEFQKVSKKGYKPVFLCSPAVRSAVFQVLQRILPSSNFSVLSHKEIPQDIHIKNLGQVRVVSCGIFKRRLAIIYL